MFTKKIAIPVIAAILYFSNIQPMLAASTHKIEAYLQSNADPVHETSKFPISRRDRRSIQIVLNQELLFQLADNNEEEDLDDPEGSTITIIIPQPLADNNEEEDLDDPEGSTITIIIPQPLADNNEEEDLDDPEGSTITIIIPQPLADNNEEEDLDDPEGLSLTIILRQGLAKNGGSRRW